jgi:hypothetical protein
MLFDHEPITLREKSMLYLVNSLTDKPEWARKVYDEEVIRKWEQEALSLDWSKISGDRHGMSKQMFNYVRSDRTVRWWRLTSRDSASRSSVTKQGCTKKQV